MGTSDHRPWHIPGPCPLQSRPLRQSPWAAVAQLHGAYPRAMGQTDQALPVLTLLAPSEHIKLQRDCRHKLLTDWARQGALQLSRWLSSRRIIFVGDSSFAVPELAHAVTPRATLISRLRLDASLFAPLARRTARKMGRPAQKGPALPNSIPCFPTGRPAGQGLSSRPGMAMSPARRS